MALTQAMAETKLLLWGRNDDGQLGNPPSYVLGSSPPPSVKSRGRRSFAEGETSPGNQTQQASSTMRPLLEAMSGRRHISRGSISSLDVSSHTPLQCQVLTGSRVLQVSCGSRHTLAVVEGGEAYSWGWGACGQLGHGGEKSVSTPKLIDRLKKNEAVTYVSAGGIHSAAITASGRVYTWGGSSYGQLGLGPEVTAEGVQAFPGKVMLSKTESPRGSSDETGSNGLAKCITKTREEMVSAMYTAPKVELLATKVACGGMHTAAVTEEGIVYCWGRADSGQLGIGSEWVHETSSGVMGVEWPRRVRGHLEGRRTVSISCGGFHTAALTAEGGCFTWGKEDHGMLGCTNEALLKGGLFLPHPVTLRRPKAKTSSDQESFGCTQKAVAVACGGWHTAVIGEKGGVWTCGRGEFGRLGLGDQKSQWLLAPVSLEGEREAAAAEGVEEKVGSIILHGGNETGLLRVGGVQNGAGVAQPVGQGGVFPVSGWKVMPPSPASPASVEMMATLGVSVLGVVTNGGGDGDSGDGDSGDGDGGDGDGGGVEGEDDGDGVSSVEKMEMDGSGRAADRATMIALGGSHSMVLTASGRVFAFGRQENGRLGVEVDAPRHRSGDRSKSSKCSKHTRPNDACAKDARPVCEHPTCRKRVGHTTDNCFVRKREASEMSDEIQLNYGKTEMMLLSWHRLRTS